MKKLEDRKRWSGLIAMLGALVLAIGCTGETPGDGTGDGDGDGDGDNGDQWEDKLNDREPDYNAALRIAALRLTGDLPTLTEISAIADAPNDQERGAIYRNLIDQYIDGRPSFDRQIFSFFEDTYKMGDSDNLHAAAALALDILQNVRPFTELLTASTGNCPTVTFDADGVPAVTAADCASGYPDGQAGVLTSQQFQAQFYSNMAFKRVRAVHELFDCRALPGATRAEPVELPDGKFFEGEFDFETITGINNNDAPNVDFQDTSAVICANCHSSMNHQAPLFLNFDEAGIYQAESQVIVPVPGEPLAQLSDYLIDGEPFAWRPGVTVNNLVELGSAMAEDPAVIECFVARAWNWTMGRNDIVDAVASVPTEVIQPFIDSFANNNYNYKELVRSMFKSDDFILF